MKRVLYTAGILLLLASVGFGQLWDLGTYPVPGFDNARLLRPYGDCVFLTQYASTLFCYYVANPSSPLLAGQMNLYLHGYLTIAENTLYVSGGSFTNSVFVIDITDPGNMTQSTSIYSGSSCELEARGNYLYIADYGGSIKIYDITNRLFPVPLSVINGVGTAYGLVLSDDYLYVAVASYGIKIYNIASPANPQFVSSLYTSTGSYPLLEKDGDYLYLASYSSGHKVIDVSNVNNPVLVNSVNPISLDQQISLSNGLLFTGNWYGGIYMYDFTNINNLVLLCNTPSLSNGTFDVDVAGPYLYVADLACFRTMGYQTNRDGYYRWMLSEYEWEDIIVNGTPWPAGDDTFTDIIPIGFDFPFYDHSYDSLYACSNGFIAFNNYSPSYWNTPIPCNTQPNNIIAPLWDNFDVTGCPSRIYTQYFDNPERFVIEYFEVPRVGTGEFETFEIILYPDGNIKFQYPNIVNSRSVTIGVENETGSRGNLVTHNPHRTIPDSTAVIFYRLDSLEPGMGSPELSRGAITDRVEFLNAAPNPFNAETTISFQLNRACEVALTVYDVRGCVTASLAEGSLAAGYYSYRFDAGNLSSGIYFARLTAGKETKTQRLLLVK